MSCKEIVTFIWCFWKQNQKALWKLFNIAFLFCRLSGIKDLVRGKQLVSVILKLMGYCVKLKVLVCLELFCIIFSRRLVYFSRCWLREFIIISLQVNRQYLCLPTLNTLNVLLGTLNQVHFSCKTEVTVNWFVLICGFALLSCIEETKKKICFKSSDQRSTLSILAL